jgi:hypothetical protein
MIIIATMPSVLCDFCKAGRSERQPGREEFTIDFYVLSVISNNTNIRLYI